MKTKERRAAGSSERRALAGKGNSPQGDAGRWRLAPDVDHRPTSAVNRRRYRLFANHARPRGQVSPAKSGPGDSARRPG